MGIVLTGAAGFLGSHLGPRLVALGYPVVGLDAFPRDEAWSRRSTNALALREAGVDVRRVDLATAPLAGHLAGAEVVIHLAAQTGLSDESDAARHARNTVEATRRLVAAAAAAPTVRTFLHASTSSVYGAHATGPEAAPIAPISAYGRAKADAERTVLEAFAEGPIAACALRLYSLYGPRDRPDKLYPRILRALADGAPLPLYEGSERHERSFTYVADAVEGFVRALARREACRGEAVNLGLPRPHTTPQMVAAVEALTGRAVPTEPRPGRPGDQSRTHAVVDKAVRLLGYAPATGLHEGLRESLAHDLPDALLQPDAPYRATADRVVCVPAAVSRRRM